MNVADLDRAIEFYGKLFGTEPAKVRPGYANFSVEDPPLKLVLIESEGRGGTLNHLGVEVGSTGEVEQATSRLSQSGLDTRVQEQTSCCYAVQDKVWVSDQDGAQGEEFTVRPDDPIMVVVATDPRHTTRPPL